MGSTVTQVLGDAYMHEWEKDILHSRVAPRQDVFQINAIYQKPTAFFLDLLKSKLRLLIPSQISADAGDDSVLYIIFSLDLVLNRSRLINMKRNLRDAVIQAHELGRGQREIARFLGIPLTTVNRDIKRYEETGSNEDRPGNDPAKPRNRIVEARIDQGLG
ncbi:unnamed protein product [Didymodactylos carnosus]|uniref:Uncharacterized protein n=1 Tax=Didymodactylos carnosus TaxID=1234261 RepID=A0A8S2FK11_9BILA|nr:unnamed protein product [Didymodactylos carnosus]CAF4279669.1 unnamed protein product [Didymodactylos carnosus]